MHAWIDTALQWVLNNELLLTAITLSSILTFFGSLLFIPWLIIQLPANYFCDEKHDRFNPLGKHPVAVLIVDIVRNGVGICFIGIGLMLIVLPGQGLLTIIIGLLITRFPGKRRFVHWLVSKKSIHRTVNWIRRKYDRPEIELIRQQSEPE